ncbi:alpha/beta-hydrolase [Marasmius fiardii PR-910]|nr:alpha/beta-hydrolase [Marasmius fiardii PR-910]
MLDAGVALLDHIGKPVILMTHSQAGAFGWLLGDARHRLVKAIIALEPLGPPFISAVFPPFTSARPYGLTELPLHYYPPISSSNDISPQLVNSIPNVTCYEQAFPARKLVNLAGIPALVVTAEASYHILYDNCTVNFLKQAGVDVDHVELGNVGFHGNGHLMFLEKNSHEIADQVVNRWIIEEGLW